jgi:RHS repeat-associated protein
MSNSLPSAIFNHGWTTTGNMAWEFAAPLPHSSKVPTRSMTYDADNRLASFKGPSMGSYQNVGVDLDGNITNAPLTNDTFSAYTFDARNRLSNAGGVTNSYDALNNRIGQTYGTNTTTYNTAICRFVNPDPSGFKGGLNLYAHAYGNPVSLLDPFGLCAELNDESHGVKSFSSDLGPYPYYTFGNDPVGFLAALGGNASSILLNSIDSGFLAGYLDARFTVPYTTFSIPKFIRQQAGWDQNTDYNSYLYKSGQAVRGVEELNELISDFRNLKNSEPGSIGKNEGVNFIYSFSSFHIGLLLDNNNSTLATPNPEISAPRDIVRAKVLEGGNATAIARALSAYSNRQ